MKVERIIIFTMKKDLRLTRICVASIRMFYPEIRIDLVKDESKGEFSTSDLEIFWKCGLESFGQERLGGSGMLIKLQPLSQLSDSTTLLLDNDTVFAGRVFDRLADVNADFVVSQDTAYGDLNTQYGRQLVRAFLFDQEGLAAIEPDFKFSGRMFNAGHIVFRPSAIPVKMVARFLQFTPVRFVFRDIFQMGDQGFWNFLFQSLDQQGRAKLEYVPFAVYPNNLTSDLIPAMAGSGEWPNQIVHWAGQHDKGRLRDMPGGHILKHFERCYYEKVPWGWWKRHWRALKFCGRYWVSWGYRLVLRPKRK